MGMTSETKRLVAVVREDGGGGMVHGIITPLAPDLFENLVAGLGRCCHHPGDEDEL